MATVHIYDIGDLVILRNGTFTSSTGDPIDPSVINVKVQNPHYEDATYTYGTDANVEKLATGIYRCTIKPMLPGMWYYRWEAVDPSALITTAMEGAEEHRFSVRPSAFIYA